MRTLVAIVLSTVMLSSNANAFSINISADINTKTKYSKCEPVADRICQLVASFVKAKESERPELLRKIRQKKRKLKRCEEKERKWYRRVRNSIAGGSVQVTHQF